MRQNCTGGFYRLILLTAIVLITNVNTMRSQNGILSNTEVAVFLDVLAKRASEVTALSARFEQVKRMEMIKGELVSHGKFLYSKENKIAFMYEKPGKYSMIMNGSYMKMVTASGTSTMNLSANPVMKQMQELITAVFTGELKESANYDIVFSMAADKINASVKPKSARLQSVISIINIVFSKDSGDILEISVKEGSGGTTNYRFFDQTINQNIDNEIFRIN
ncbi:Outer-membrane lipoprotein carrier protein [bioreactor metagenome]|jgi:outer membrane lipoprotein-sorting protein|uniref:Outer-membrane lipoprotein carrier protein n=1 Tax=bioreactor metagenome TaxID=1076179 RepID=A0A644ULF8_9ZZZZ